MITRGLQRWRSHGCMCPQPGPSEGTRLCDHARSATLAIAWVHVPATGAVGGDAFVCVITRGVHVWRMFFFVFSLFVFSVILCLLFALSMFVCFLIF